MQLKVMYFTWFHSPIEVKESAGGSGAELVGIPGAAGAVLLAAMAAYPAGLGGGATAAAGCVVTGAGALGCSTGFGLGGCSTGAGGCCCGWRLTSGCLVRSRGTCRGDKFMIFRVAHSTL